MKNRWLLVPMLLLGACEPAHLVTSPEPADRDARIVHLAPGEYLLGHRSTAADLVGTVSLVEIRRQLTDTVGASRQSNTTNASRAIGPDQPRSSTVIGGTVSSFAGFQNFATETNRWWPVIGDSAYYRDLSIAAVQSIDLPHDGDTWSVQVTLPDGSLFDFPTVIFHSSWNGAFNCFVVSGSGQSACGVTGIDLYSTRQVQCGQTGKWTFRMSLNGVQYEERTIKVVAKVDERYVPLMAQGDPAWGSQLYAHSCTVEKMVNGKLKRVGYDCPDENPLHDSIHGKGCAITSAAMVMGYHGASDANSSTLNTWLRDNNGYQEGGATDFDYVADFAQLQGAADFSFDAGYRAVVDANVLKGLICKYGPQEIAVRGTSHFVVAFGYDEERHTFVIHDPAGGVSRTLEYYGNRFDGIRLMTGRERTDTLFTGMTVTFHSPVEGILTDPAGRRTGVDAMTGVSYAEIPLSYADSSFFDNDEDPSLAATESVKEIHVDGPVAGSYTVTVVGTGDGTYTAQFSTRGAVNGTGGRTTLRDVPITLGEVHSYQFKYDPTAGNVPVAVGGAFQGGGQRDDVDSFLTYLSPTERQIALIAGTATARLRIVYSPAIVPTTFNATLAGADITDKFHPTAGGSETVILPLGAGRNVLKLSVDGVVGGRHAADRGQLTFVVK